jgi:hypothetical protein
MVVLDETQDPVVPFLLYQMDDGESRTKQLIFSGKRGCATQAGDLPCVSEVYEQSPQLQAGQRIRVTGAIVGDQILVDRIEQA